MDESENIGELLRRQRVTLGKIPSHSRQVVPFGEKHPRLSRGADQRSAPISQNGASLPRSVVDAKRSILLPPVTNVKGGEDTVCPVCKGAGYLRRNVAVSHPLFGRAIKCQCRVMQ